MVSKTIKISEENYKWLLHVAAELQKTRGKIVSLDEALENFKENKKRDIMDLAGAWKMSDEEAKKFIGKIYKERKLISRRI